MAFFAWSALFPADAQTNSAFNEASKKKISQLEAGINHKQSELREYTETRQRKLKAIDDSIAAIEARVVRLRPSISDAENNVVKLRQDKAVSQPLLQDAVNSLDHLNDDLINDKAEILKLQEERTAIAKDDSFEKEIRKQIAEDSALRAALQSQLPTSPFVLNNASTRHDPATATPVPIGDTTVPFVGFGTMTEISAPQLKGEDRLLLDTLNSIVSDIKVSDQDLARKKLMREFLEKSRPFTEKFPNQTNLWLMRATAAISLNDTDAGCQAGKKLKSLGILDDDDPEIRKLMAALNRKGWLNDADVERAKAQAVQKKWWSGNWAGQKIWVDNLNFKRIAAIQLAIPIQPDDITNIHVGCNIQNLNASGSLVNEDNYQMPGSLNYVNYSSSGGTTAGQCRILNCDFDNDASHIKATIEIVSNNTAATTFSFMLTRVADQAKFSFFRDDGSQVAPPTLLARAKE